MPQGARKRESIPAGQSAAMTERLSSVPAAWPTGVSQLAQAIDTCHRCDSYEVCADWTVRAPETIGFTPVFCPNAAEINDSKAETERC